MGEGEGGRRLRLRPRGAHAPEGEPLARRGVSKRSISPSPQSSPTRGEETLGIKVLPNGRTPQDRET